MLDRHLTIFLRARNRGSEAPRGPLLGVECQPPCWISPDSARTQNPDLTEETTTTQPHLFRRIKAWTEPTRVTLVQWRRRTRRSARLESPEVRVVLTLDTTVTITATHAVHATEAVENNNLTVNCNAAPRTRLFHPPAGGLSRG